MRLLGDPLLKAKLQFFISVATEAEPFLELYQSDKITHSLIYIHSLARARAHTHTRSYCDTLFFLSVSLSHTQSQVHVHFIHSNGNVHDEGQEGQSDRDEGQEGQ